MGLNRDSRYNIQIRIRHEYKREAYIQNLLGLGYTQQIESKGMASHAEAKTGRQIERLPEIGKPAQSKYKTQTVDIHWKCQETFLKASWVFG